MAYGYGVAMSRRGTPKRRAVDSRSFGSTRGATARERVGILSVRAVPKWSVGLMALAGAWLGHFVEYVRVAGWSSALHEMSSSAHSYFFPAGAALTAFIFGVVVLARRAWALLGRRIRTAKISLWMRPKSPPNPSAGDTRGEVGVAGLWVLLSTLQTVTWICQENLEAIGSGHRAPLLGVVSGAQWLAPVIEAEIALILAAGYVLVHRRFSYRRSQLVVIERLVARRWTPNLGLLPVRIRAAWVPSTPLERWGRQGWQRPPPVGIRSV